MPIVCTLYSHIIMLPFLNCLLQIYCSYDSDIICTVITIVVYYFMIFMYTY